MRCINCNGTMEKVDVSWWCSDCRICYGKDIAGFKGAFYKQTPLNISQFAYKENFKEYREEEEYREQEGV